jgi:hypothetical protein
MTKGILTVVCWMMIALAAGCARRTEATGNAPSGSEPARPSPLDDQLPRLPAKIIAADTVRTRVADKAQPAADQSPKDQPGTDWGVVMAIYKEYGAAERRARNVAQGSAFKATVFPAEGQGSKYMVVLESGLSYARAVQVRERAVSGGLPADTYVTRLGPRD